MLEIQRDMIALQRVIFINLFFVQYRVGSLQNAGNTTTLAHYLDLLSGVGLLCGLQKFANQTVRQKSSSPKFAVYNTALMSAQMGKSPHEAKQDSAYWGRLVESAVGAYLLNQIRSMRAELFYWRENDLEVDFVLRHQDTLIAIEVKSRAEWGRQSGMDAFAHQFHPKKRLLIGESGIQLKEFFTTPISEFW